ncbi:proline-rich protein 36-like isoform X4 [Numida meleagris]|uniref:proline-rich protein 36-like isoform X4 n=1 Tax=Numida meleagris TaxID=8996 RepID=UPI000B3D8ED3|nr:proline-rich protein 36-like isoform X4 [Numida meleagris]
MSPPVTSPRGVPSLSPPCHPPVPRLSPSGSPVCPLPPPRGCHLLVTLLSLICHPPGPPGPPSVPCHLPRDVTSLSPSRSSDCPLSLSLWMSPPVTSLSPSCPLSVTLQVLQLSPVTSPWMSPPCHSPVPHLSPSRSYNCPLSPPHGCHLLVTLLSLICHPPGPPSVPCHLPMDVTSLSLSCPSFVTLQVLQVLQLSPLTFSMDATSCHLLVTFLSPICPLSPPQRCHLLVTLQVLRLSPVTFPMDVTSLSPSCPSFVTLQVLRLSPVTSPMDVTSCHLLVTLQVPRLSPVTSPEMSPPCRPPCPPTVPCHLLYRCHLCVTPCSFRFPQLFPVTSP